MTFAGNIQCHVLGYLLSVQYKNQGILKEHHYTRNACTLFDVSHMGNIKLYGERRYDFIERMAVADVRELKKGNAILSVLMNKDGGVVDDTIITNMGDHM